MSGPRDHPADLAELHLRDEADDAAILAAGDWSCPCGAHVEAPDLTRCPACIASNRFPVDHFAGARLVDDRD